MKTIEDYEQFLPSLQRDLTKENYDEAKQNGELYSLIMNHYHANKLTKAEKQMVDYYYDDQLDFGKIAKYLKISKAAAKKRWSRMKLKVLKPFKK